VIAAAFPPSALETSAIATPTHSPNLPSPYFCCSNLSRNQIVGENQTLSRDRFDRDGSKWQQQRLLTCAFVLGAGSGWS
jgi:hypothetical protein